MKCKFELFAFLPLTKAWFFTIITLLFLLINLRNSGAKANLLNAFVLKAEFKVSLLDKLALKAEIKGRKQKRLKLD